MRCLDIEALTHYIQLFAKFGVPIFTFKLGFALVIIGPIKLKPLPFPPLGNTDDSSGLLELDFESDEDLTCESKGKLVICYKIADMKGGRSNFSLIGGSVGEEELQCWESSNNVNPKIMGFKNVDKLGGKTKQNINGGRRLQESGIQFNCLLSESDMTGSTSITINYERCPIDGDVFDIGLTKAVGVGVTLYSSALDTATVTMPSPIQDLLVTVVRDCNAEWIIHGYTNILVYGSQVLSGCKVRAAGSSEAPSIITIDFEQGPCTSGHSVTLNEGSIVINGNEIVVFGAPYKNIIFMMSKCDDTISISNTYSDALSIEILGNGGNDSIQLTQVGAAFDRSIFGNIIIDGGDGSDDLWIHDESSLVSKHVEVHSTLISGIHASSSHNIAYFGIENMDISLGTAYNNVTVLSTPEGASLKVTTQGEPV